MNPKYQRTADRLRELIDEGEQVANLEQPSEYLGPYIQDYTTLHAWLVRVENIIRSVFRRESAHAEHLATVMKENPNKAYEVHKIIGILKGALSDIEGGFLIGQEHLIASGVLDSVLEQTRHLAHNGYKDPAAVLARVVVEDALRRLCREEKLDDSAKTSAMNEALYKKGRYLKPQWRLIQSWLDIGNSASHGKFSEYTEEDVLRIVDDVERFLAQELRS